MSPRPASKRPSAAAGARRLRGAATRERILAAATELIGERGYAGTGIEALCQRAGVARTAIYWHFGSKEGLLVPVVERAANAWIEEIRKTVYLEPDPLARLDRFVAGLRELVLERPQLLRLLLHVALERGAHDAATREALRALIGRAHDAIVQGLEDSIGAARPEAELVARIALAFLDAAVAAQLVDPRPSEVARLFDDLRTTILLVIGARLRAFADAGGAPGGDAR